MDSLRDRISDKTGFYFSDKIKMSESFKKLAKAGRFDLKAVIGIIGVLSDYLEELEKKADK
ncbi:MAG: hypothetical protein DRN81_04775 [Thermoproteota archaeon]|nr:MAG: hypothetical protein DRN81_04775 [Candidatus Korarchaeota archaeon]